MQIIPQPSPGIHALNIQPGCTIRQRRKEAETPEGQAQNDKSSNPPRDKRFAAHAFIGLHEPAGAGLAGWIVVGGVGAGTSAVDGLDVEDKFNQGAGDESRRQVCGEVVVEETLTAH